MRRNVTRALSVLFALALVTTALGGAISMGVVDREQVDPTGDAQAIACGGLCIAGVAGAAAIAGGAIHAEYFATEPANETELAAADALEAEKNVYQAASTQRQNSEILQDSYSNYLQDTKNTARMIGKNAYVRSLENGSSEVAARTDARDAVADYYANKQIQLANSYDVAVNYSNTLKNQLNQTTDANASLLYLDYANNGGSQVGPAADAPVSLEATKTVTLANGSSASHQAVSITDNNSPANTVIISPGMDQELSDNQINIGGGTMSYDGLEVAPPDSNFETLNYVKVWELQDAWDNIESQNTQVQSEVDDFVNATYSGYQQGDINTTELVDPYMESRQYSPDSDYGAFTLRSLTSMGVSPPENLSTTGSMNITNHATGNELNGVLMSDGTPTSGSFDVGTKYDSTTLTGAQYVVDADSGSTTELTGNFTVTGATDASGEPLNQSTIGYNEVDYTTTDISEYKALNAELQNLTAQIESRQQKLRSGGGGGLFAGIGGSFGLGLSDAQAGAVLLLLAFLALALLAVLD